MDEDWRVTRSWRPAHCTACRGASLLAVLQPGVEAAVRAHLVPVGMGDGQIGLFKGGVPKAHTSHAVNLRTLSMVARPVCQSIQRAGNSVCICGIAGHALQTQVTPSGYADTFNIARVRRETKAWRPVVLIGAWLRVPRQAASSAQTRLNLCDKRSDRFAAVTLLQ